MEPVSLSLAGKNAIVTGASRRQGIGAAVCRVFAAHGADIVFTHWQPYDRVQHYGPDEDGPTALERELRDLGVRAHAVPCDLSDPEAPARLLGQVRELLGAPSILVNNAVHSERNSFRDLDAAALDRAYAVNVRGMALLSVEFARRYAGGPGGRIVNLTSGQSVGAMPGELAYVTTKGAVEAFTTTLAAEVAGKGITVNAIDPGATDTGWMTPEFRAQIVAESAFGRVGMPTDAARLILFLASDAGAWITGQILHSRGA